MKHKAIKLLGLLGATAAVTLLGVGEAKAIIAVDTFEVDHFIFSTTTDTFDQSDENLTNSIIGGERDVSFEVIQNPGGFPPNTVAGADQGNDQLALGEDSSDQGRITLTYDGNDNDGSSFNSSSGLNSIDVTENDANLGFLFEITTQSSDSTNLEVELFSGLTSTSASISNSNTTGNLFFEFVDDGDSTNSDAFFESSPGTFDFNNVTGIRFILSSDDAGDDVILDAIGFAPSRTSSIPQGNSATAVPFEAEHSVGFGFLLAWGAWRHWKSRKANKVEAN